MPYAAIPEGEEDQGARFFAVCSVALLSWALLDKQSFIKVTTYSWATAYLMGYIKLFLLGTLGEIIKYRIKKGSWSVDKLWQRAFVWGFFGVWFTAAFPGYEGSVQYLAQKGLWFKWWAAFWKSCSINAFGGFALFMMWVHEYTNFLIRHGWRIWRLEDFSAEVDKQFVFAYLPKTIPIWIGLHTITYALPSAWRVLAAGLLAIFLGFILSVGRRKS